MNKETNPRKHKMEQKTKRNIVLALLSGILLGISFPPSPLYSLAYVALIPLLYLFDRLESWKSIIRYSYFSMFVFHAITLYWVGGFTHGKDPYLMAAGAALLVAHPMFYWIPILAYWFVKKRLGGTIALLTLPLFWVAYEYSHSLSEFSFPWITLGNSQAYETYRIQIAEITSVYGLSFVILYFNAIAYWLLVQFIAGKGRPPRRVTLSAIVILVLLYFGPWVYGRVVVNSEVANDSRVRLKAGIVQPNIDPWEKWGEGSSSKWESYQKQLGVLMPSIGQAGEDSLDLLVWPETAIPFYVLLPQNKPYLDLVRSAVQKSSVPLFTGIPHAEYFDLRAAPPTARLTQDGSRKVEYYNSATLFAPAESTQIVYKKVVLVPFAERVPYAETLTFLVEPLKWDVGISGWGKGSDLNLFGMKTRVGDSVRFSGMICYESIYPDYVRQFVKNGSELLIIVTNDSWWGKTSGAYQHAAYASFRAIENRRWIIRCANGGISGFVDPYGQIHHQTSLYTSQNIVQTIEARHELTFYAEYGDAFALACVGGAGAVFLIAVGIRRKGGGQIESR